MTRRDGRPLSSLDGHSLRADMAVGVPPERTGPPQLLSLPPELLAACFSRLPTRDRGRLAQVSRRLNALLRQPGPIWSSVWLDCLEKELEEHQMVALLGLLRCIGAETQSVTVVGPNRLPLAAAVVLAATCFPRLRCLDYTGSGLEVEALPRWLQILYLTGTVASSLFNSGASLRHLTTLRVDLGLTLKDVSLWPTVLWLRELRHLHLEGMPYLRVGEAAQLHTAALTGLTYLSYGEEYSPEEEEGGLGEADIDYASPASPPSSLLHLPSLQKCCLVRADAFAACVAWSALTALQAVSVIEDGTEGFDVPHLALAAVMKCATLTELVLQSDFIERDEPELAPLAKVESLMLLRTYSGMRRIPACWQAAHFVRLRLKDCTELKLDKRAVRVFASMPRLADLEICFCCSGVQFGAPTCHVRNCRAFTDKSLHFLRLIRERIAAFKPCKCYPRVMRFLEGSSDGE